MRDASATCCTEVRLMIRPSRVRSSSPASRPRPLPPAARVTHHQPHPDAAAHDAVSRSRPFGRTPDGDSRGSDHAAATATASRSASMTYGGTILSLKTPDRTGALDDIVLGFDDVRAVHRQVAVLRRASSAATATASRRASSRSTARPTRSRRTTAPNHLHGGTKGFDKVRLEGRARSRTPAASASTFTLHERRTAKRATRAR